MGEKITEEMRDKWDSKIGFLFDYGSEHFNEFEEEFIDNVARRRAQNMDLSARQALTLNRIYAKIQKLVG